MYGGEHTGFSEKPEEPDFEGQEETGVVLNSVLNNKIQHIHYEYDYGDRWHHLMEIEERICIPPRHLVNLSCIGGERSCPPEDIGGVTGYSDIVEALTSHNHPDYAWARDRCGKGYDPKYFDLERTNIELNKYLRWSRDRLAASNTQ